MTDDSDHTPVHPDAVFGGGAAGGGDLSAALEGFDLGSLMGAAEQLQQQMADAQEAAANTVIEGVAGGGAVKIRVTGTGIYESVELRPDAVDPSDIEMLQDLILAALHDAVRQIEDLQQGSFGGGLDGILGGGLGGLFGGPEQ